MIDTILTASLGMVRSIGRTLGYELVVELSDHSISTSMERVDREKRAWDTDLYKYGNVFVAGYANPIKPKVNQNDGLENPDHIDVREGEPDTPESEHPELPEGESESEGDGPQIQLIASGRYKPYMRQHLVEQLLTPESRWNLLVWAVIALGVLMFMNMMVVLWATGSF